MQIIRTDLNKDITECFFWILVHSFILLRVIAESFLFFALGTFNIFKVPETNDFLSDVLNLQSHCRWKQFDR